MGTTAHRLHLGDARALPGTPDASVDLVVTSPPYPMVEMWDAGFGAASKEAAHALDAGDGMRAFEAMHRVLDEVWASCLRVLRPGGFLCINVGDAARTIGDAFVLYPNHARILQACLALGLTPLPAVIWRKQTNAPNKFLGSGMLPAGAYVTLEHEFILILRKGDKRSFASAAQRTARQQSAFFWEERNLWFSDLWDFKGERQAVQDPDVVRRSGAFPFELPFRLVNMYSAAGDTVLDPFAGTGTTLAAALALARNSIGYEIDPAIHRVAVERLKASGEQANARNRQRLEGHVAFVARCLAEGKELAHTSEPYGFPVMTSQERTLRLLQVEAVRQAAPGRIEAVHGFLDAPRAPDSAPARRQPGKRPGTLTLGSAS